VSPEQLAASLAYAEQHHGPPLDMFALLMEQDEQLVAAGFPAMSPLWRAWCGELYGHPTAYRFVGQVGRRGGKSTTMDRVMVIEGLHGTWDIPPGQAGVFPIFSIKVGFAEDRLTNIAAILVALGVEHRHGSDKKGAYIRLGHKPIEWRAFAANFRTAVSFTAIGFLADELARWHDDRTGANPATHVLESVRPAMATQLCHGAKELLISSPWATLDAHYDAHETGDNEDQIARRATTWEANPSLTEAACRRLCKKEQESGEASDLDREYRAIPMTSSEVWFFNHADIDASARFYPMPVVAEAGTIVTSGADYGFARNSSALVVAHRPTPDGPITIAEALEVKVPAEGSLKPSETVERFAAAIKRHGCGSAMSDIHYAETIREHLNKHDLVYNPAPHDNVAPYVRLRALLAEGKVVLPKNKQLLRDLKEVKSKPISGSRIKVILPTRPDGSHCDLVSALVLATWPKDGVAMEAPSELPDGWTQEELDEADAVAQEMRDEADAMGYGYVDTEGEWA